MAHHYHATVRLLGLAVGFGAPTLIAGDVPPVTGQRRGGPAAGHSPTPGEIAAAASSVGVEPTSPRPMRNAALAFREWRNQRERPHPAACAGTCYDEPPSPSWSAILLDLASIRLFILTVELGNLTRAAEAADTVQPVVSVRIKGLEAAVGRRLLERTPRFVRPTADGVAFLAKARALMAAHDDATRFDGRPTTRFAIGASDHALGTGPEHVIRHVRAVLPSGSTIELRLGLFQHVRASFDDGELDAIVVRREAGGSEGEVLGTDPLGWRSAADEGGPDGVVPLVTLGPPCGIRAVATRHLDAAGRSGTRSSGEAAPRSRRPSGRCCAAGDPRLDHAPGAARLHG